MTTDERARLLELLWELEEEASVQYTTGSVRRVNVARMAVLEHIDSVVNKLESAH